MRATPPAPRYALCQIADVEFASIPDHHQVGGRAANSLPVQPSQRCLQVGPVKLAIAQQGYGGRRRNERLDLVEQRTAACLRKCPFLPCTTTQASGNARP